MFDWLRQLADPDHREFVVLVGTLLGAVSAASWTAFRGLTNGKPTSTAVAAAIANTPPVCAARDFGPIFERVRADIAEVSTEVREVRAALAEVRDLMIRIEDRTRSRHHD